VLFWLGFHSTALGDGNAWGVDIPFTFDWSLGALWD
jgi:hypothetical protein